MIYYYVLTFITGNIIYQINYVVIGIHIIAEILLVVLGFKNPGILHKIIEDYDTPTKIHIPFDKDCKPAVN